MTIGELAGDFDRARYTCDVAAVASVLWGEVEECPPERNPPREFPATGIGMAGVKPVDIDEYFRSIGDVGRYWVPLNRTPTEYPRADTIATAGR